MHPSSVNSQLDGGQWRSAYVAFHERVRTTKVYMRDSTPVPPLAMMLLAGGELTREHGGGPDGSLAYVTGGDGSDEIMALDGFYRLHVPSAAAALVVELRDRIQALVRRLVNSCGSGGGGGEDNRSGGGRDGRGGRHNNNNPGPAAPSTGDREGETIVRDTVEALAHISKWQDVRLVPELSSHEKKKLENMRRNAAKQAAQREAKMRRQQQARGGGRGGGKGGRGGGGGGGRRGGRTFLGWRSSRHRGAKQLVQHERERWRRTRLGGKRRRKRRRRRSTETTP